jgi:hypothetical protein
MQIGRKLFKRAMVENDHKTETKESVVVNMPGHEIYVSRFGIT